ncbi:hypothetical protein [Alkalicoccus halolimnae]|uniref:Uncharacterized protein n=1 Tax=Alkalicoccus halolimnae TaxID=1667239 RepID=A0AAJ8LT01_9BACI|nr:hypothetical protein [Alkalicoccus halolimnae]
MKLAIGVAIFSITALILYFLLDIGTDVPTEVAVIAALGGGALLEWSYFEMQKRSSS